MGKRFFWMFMAVCLGFCLFAIYVWRVDVKRDSGSNDVKEFTAFFAVPGIELDDDNEIKAMITKATGVSVDENWISNETVEDAVNRLIKNNELPDFIDAGDYSARLYEEGVLVPLDEYIDKYPNIKKLYTEAQWNQLKQSDGHVYWLPQFSSVYGRDRECLHSGEAFWIQERVLEWADFPEIRTLNQYFDLIERYYAANPTMADGTEIIPYTILCEDWRYFCLENPPQFLDGYPNDGSVIVDPLIMKVLDYNTTPTAKTYFNKLNEEYKKGIVDPGSFTQTYEEYVNKLSSGRVLGMVDQWWDFAYSAEDAIKANGLDEQGCQYIPLPVTISENVQNQWHTSGASFHSSSGLAITTSCEDVEGALQFVDDLLNQELHNLRFWGVEGQDYDIDEAGLFYRTAEMRARFLELDYKKSHICTYSYFPQWQGTSRDAMNAMQPAGQESEFYYGLTDKVKKCFDAYGVKTYVEMLGANEEPGPWYPMYTFSQSMTPATEGGAAWAEIEKCKHQYLPRVVMADNFERSWQQYMEAYASCKPENFLKEMQNELERRVLAASEDYEESSE